MMMIIMMIIGNLASVIAQQAFSFCISNDFLTNDLEDDRNLRLFSQDTNTYETFCILLTYTKSSKNYTACSFISPSLSLPLPSLHLSFYPFFPPPLLPLSTKCSFRRSLPYLLPLPFAQPFRPSPAMPFKTAFLIYNVCMG